MGSKNRRSHNAVRAAAKQARRRKRIGRSSDISIVDHGPDGPAEPGDCQSYGYVEFAPPMTVVEFAGRVEAGERITVADIELTDPPLGQALRRRKRTWVDPGQPPNSLWELEGSEDPNHEYSAPLWISVSPGDDGPRWSVYYPALDDSRRDPDEVFASRNDLLDALDRLEVMRGGE